MNNNKFNRIRIINIIKDKNIKIKVFKKLLVV
jgi:hypothetical protein